MKDPENARDRGRRFLAWAVLAVLLAGVSLDGARAGCREAAEPLLEALAARDLEAALYHYEAVHGEFACTGAYRDEAKRAVSNLHAWVAQERVASGASLASQRVLLERGRGYAGTWRILALLGDIAHAAWNYDRAAALYQEALMAINNKGETPKRPSDPEIDRIYRLAEQSRMLAEHYVAVPTNRSGEPDGLAAPTIRGFKPEEVVVPITFKTGTAEFDALGRRYAEDMAESLIRRAPERIILSAHTDERGTDAYNQELSERRGEAVRRFLRGRGVTQPIDVKAMGESQPLDLFEPESYPQEAVWRMNRRVELNR